MTNTFVNVDKEKQAFKDLLPSFIDSIVLAHDVTAPEIKPWIRKILEYILDRKDHRGVAVSIGYLILESPEYITEETLHSARLLGWCVELMQAFLLMIDDILDDSTSRNGKLCWHRLPNIGVNAMTDVLFMQMAFSTFLKETFGDSAIYNDICQLFHLIQFDSAVAEHLESQVSWKTNKDFKLFSLDRFHVTSSFKGTFYNYKVPLQLDVLLLKNKVDVIPEEIKEICGTLEKLCVIKNDYTDVFGEECVTGKAGTDIQEGKFTWVAVTALQRCDETQKEIFSKFYGSKDPEHVKHIKQLYDELQIPLVYKQHVAAIEKDVVLKIDSLPSERIKLFLHVLSEGILSQH